MYANFHLLVRTKDVAGRQVHVDCESSLLLQTLYLACSRRVYGVTTSRAACFIPGCTPGMSPGMGYFLCKRDGHAVQSSQTIVIKTVFWVGCWFVH